MSSSAPDSDKDPFFAAVGERVTEIRTAARLSKEEVARRSGLSAKYVWRVEDGRQNIQLRSLIRISAALGVTLSDLMNGVEKKAAGLQAEGVGGTHQKTTTSHPESLPG